MFRLIKRAPLRIGLSAVVGIHLNQQFNSILLNDSLKPAPNSDTYENGLFKSSQLELSFKLNQYRQQRLSTSNLISHYFYKLKFWINDYLIEPLITITRFIELSCYFIPIFITLPISYLGKRNGLRSNEKSGSILWYKLIRWSLEKAGASFIKLGQWAASRTDIFPKEFCNELNKLHSNAKKHSLHYTHKILKEMFGMDVDKIFKEFNEEPIGVGAIAQVYLGKFNDELIDQKNNQLIEQKNDNNNENELPLKDEFVAIKIMHPNVTENISRDIKIMKFFALIIDNIPTMEWLSLPNEVENFEILMNLQLDLRIEALNLLKFQQNFKKNLFVNFPKPYLSFTNRFILVEEYIQGISMSKFLELKPLASKNNESFKKISDEIIDSFLQMLILNNFIHSDLHPGNIFIRFIKTNELQTEIINPSNNELIKSLNNSKDKEFLNGLSNLKKQGYVPEICFIDAGLVTELNEFNRVNFIALFNSLAEFDGYKAGELMIERSKTPETAIDTEIFALKVERLVDKIKQRTFTLGTVSIGDLLEKMLSMVRVHHVRMEGDFISVIVAILLIEGIGRQLDPELDLFASSLPILRQLSIRDQKDKLSMFKVWLTLEIRQFITLSVQDIYNLVKSDRLCANY